MNKEQIIDYWIDSSDKDFKTMEDLFKTGHYHWSLFVGHLVIEKLAKALYVKLKNEHAPPIHDVRRILEKADIAMDEEKILHLDSISRFNINARYDDYKQQFYKLCTPQFTNQWIGNIKTCREWIKKML